MPAHIPTPHQCAQSSNKIAALLARDELILVAIREHCDRPKTPADYIDHAYARQLSLLTSNMFVRNW